MKNDSSAGESLRRHFEAREPSLCNVFIIATSVVLMIAACLASAKLLIAHFSQTRPMRPMQGLGILSAPDNQALARFPTPNLELDDGHADQLALKTLQLEKLHAYSWVDRSNGIARIPINRAIDLIAARGLPQNTNSIPETRPLRLPQNMDEMLP